MSPSIRGILQLDFDGTLALGDVSVGILAHFLGAEWRERVESAGRDLLEHPDSTVLVDTMILGFAGLKGSRMEHLRVAREHHPPREGLRELIEAAARARLECHVVSNGFEFYISDYLRSASVEALASVHSGQELADGTLVYLAPDGRPTRSRFKEAWARHFLQRHDLLIYAGDGSSDVPPAQLAAVVFARDSLLASMPEPGGGRLRPFDTLHDIAKDLEGLLS